MAQGSINMSNDPNPDVPAPKLGPCCTCGTTTGVRNIIMFDRRAPVTGAGWGCAVCGLPNDGAVAVLCDECMGGEPKTVSIGFPGEGKRMPVADLPDEAFGHKPEFHQDELRGMN
jgi:hypothetical protein